MAFDRNSLGSAAPVRAEINVAPLVDVCLVLLIVCMVITPTICGGLVVRVPQTRNPRSLAADEPRITLSIERTGLVYVNSRLIPDERLDATLAEIAELEPEKRILIQADRELAYRDVRRLVERLDAAGSPRVALAADPRFR